MKHCDKKYNQYCKTCEVPLCDSCSDHKHPGSVAWFFPEVKHKHVDIRTAYQTKRQKHKQTIHDVRSELLYNARVLRRKLSSDIQSWPRKIDRGQSKIRVRGQRLKDLMDIVLLDEINKHICLLSFTAKLQKVEHRYEQSANRPVEFLHLKKKVHLSQIKSISQLAQHSLMSVFQEINMKDMVKILSVFEERVKRKLHSEGKLQMSSPMLQKYITLPSIFECGHISFVTPDRIWASDYHKLIFLDSATSDEQYCVKKSLGS